MMLCGKQKSDALSLICKCSSELILRNWRKIINKAAYSETRTNMKRSKRHPVNDREKSALRSITNHETEQDKPQNKESVVSRSLYEYRA